LAIVLLVTVPVSSVAPFSFTHFLVSVISGVTVAAICRCTCFPLRLVSDFLAFCVWQYAALGIVLSLMVMMPVPVSLV